jgi:hypothetical protein
MRQQGCTSQVVAHAAASYIPIGCACSISNARTEALQLQASLHTCGSTFINAHAYLRWQHVHCSKHNTQISAG